MDVFIAGFGVVGQGITEVIRDKQELFIKHFGEKVRIVGAFDTKSLALDPSGLDPDELLKRKDSLGKVGKDEVSDDIVKLLQDTEYDLLLEVTPTNIKDGGAGYMHIHTALSAGRHVATSNKGPLALKFRELTELAERNRVHLRYEASVGGAMPVINLSRELLMGEEIASMRGILNGTCNFILHRMKEERFSFQFALREAQELGYAETDPSYDIDGIDSACKLAILANAIFDRDVTYADVSRTGIRGISEEAVALAAEHKQVIRLIGEVSKEKLEVAPRLVPAGHPLSIGGTLNIAQLLTDLAGDVTVVGRGAGRMETASALLSDILAILKNGETRRDAKR
ncbi:MAG: homoserine dehydrogenase [Euryarchaeota archaeon]|nr:homoserine dehydrogenase [Euryarchaeota archaeon]